MKSIDSRAQIDPSVVVGPFSVIGPEASIGEGTQIIGSIVEGTVGKRCKLWRLAHVWAGATIGDDCMLAQNVMVAKASVGNNVRIQNNSAIGHYALIEDDVYIGANVVFCNSVHPSATRDDRLRRIRLKRGCVIGSNVCLVGEVTIGERAVVGAGAVVTKDVPDDATVIGAPAAAVRGRAVERTLAELRMGE